MTIGGKSGNDYISSVELFNWETGEQCFLANLPDKFGLHAGAVLDGVPVVCGGTAGDAAKTDCFEYDKTVKNWLKVKLSIQFILKSKLHTKMLCLLFLHLC
jgi:hypothetical protein